MLRQAALLILLCHVLLDDEVAVYLLPVPVEIFLFSSEMVQHVSLRHGLLSEPLINCMDVSLELLHFNFSRFLRLLHKQLLFALELFLHVTLVTSLRYFDAVLLFLYGLLEALTILLQRLQIQLILELFFADGLQLFEILTQLI